MKGGLAAQITVLHQMLEEGTAFDGTILLTCVADEEAFLKGAHHLAEKHPRADLFVMAEAHYDNVVVGADGKALLTLNLTGKGGHAARPESGINAVISMGRLLGEMDRVWTKHYEEGECGSWAPLRIWSDYPGYSLNIPDRCHVLLNKQLNIGEDAEDFITGTQQLCPAECPPISVAYPRF